MPPGTPFNAFALPYRIRVDEFTQLQSQTQQPALHLLTHTHTDHVNGLASKSFGSTVYCSRDAKEMLLRHEVYMERELYQMQLKAQKTRTYSHLKVDPITYPNGSQNYIGSRDLLVSSTFFYTLHVTDSVAPHHHQRPLPLNTPTVIELQNGEEVTLTLIDANHCPGAVMYDIIYSCWPLLKYSLGTSSKVTQVRSYTPAIFAPSSGSWTTFPATRSSNHTWHRYPRTTSHSLIGL